MDKQKLKRTLIREGIILSAVILIAWLFYNVGNNLENEINAKSREFGYNIRLTYETTYTTPGQGGESSWVGRITGRMGWINKSGSNIGRLDEFMNGETSEYTDKEV